MSIAGIKRAFVVLMLGAIAGSAGSGSCLADQVDPGWDLFTTTGPTNLGPGGFVGVPLNTFNFNSGTFGDFARGIGTQNVANTDTIIKRLETAQPGVDNSTFTTFPGVPPLTAPAAYPGGTFGRIDLEVSALQLMSGAPTDFGFGVGIYYETLVSNRSAGEGGPGPMGIGIMDIDFATNTFNSDLYIPIDLRFGSATGPIVIAGDVLHVSSTGTLWSHDAPPNALLINGVNNLLNGTDTKADFWPQPLLTEQVVDTLNIVGQHSATVSLRPVPEPGSFVLVGLGIGLAGYGWRRRQAISA